ncbi:TRAP transporter substrate-binding protein [Solibacillus sp. FSL K6-1523]|uniref:TRAP transporter substrate-binding protein n=1 Tax=Solibacillus sp. FSL K6-1523 TaxID=2921471 RepID=UPI0030F602A2
MKNFKGLFFILSMVFLLSACSEDGKEASSGTAKEETFTLKYNSAFLPSSEDWQAKSLATEKFAKLVEERSEGRIKIDIFYSNQLAGQAESLDALAKGTIDLQNITPVAWGDKIPEGSFTALPYWNINEEHSLYIMRETEIGEQYEEVTENYGVKILSYWPASATGYMSNKPIRNVSDLKGMTMNMSSDLLAGFYKEAGIGIATIPYAEQYEGLLRGTLDGIQFPFSSLKDYKLAEVVDYITKPATISPALGIVAISQKTLNKLPEDLQKILIDTALEMENEGIAASKRLTEESILYAQENNVEIVNMTKEAYEEIQELHKKTTWANYATKNERTKKMVDLLDEETEKWKKENPEMVEEFEKSLGN